MQIDVEFWGITARLAGGSKQAITLPDNATVADALLSLKTNAGLDQELKRCAFAVGDEMVTPQHPLHDGDCLAVLPPVSGG